MADVRELGQKVKAKYPGQYDDLDDGDLGRRVKAKHPGAYDDFTDAPTTVLPQDRQTFGRRPATLDESLTQSARLNRNQSQPSMPALTSGPLAEAREDQARRSRQQRFAQKPVLERVKERAGDALTRGGGQVSRMARQAAGAGLGVVQGLNSGNFTPVDLPEWREGEEGKFRTLEARRLSRPSSFATETAEGILEALPAASLAALGGIATGGSLPAAMGIGAGMGAAGADWRDPKRAAVQTALGAVAPVVGGKVGQGIGNAVASRLAPPVAQAGARVGGELVGGAAGNVIGSGAEQLAFEGKLNPRQLAQSGIIGAALNVPALPITARRPTRSNIPATQPVTVAQQEVGSVVPPPIRQTAEIPRVPTAPTREIQYPDAPPTQEMPEIRARIAAENAETRELPAVPGPTLNTTAPQVSPEIPPKMPVFGTNPPRLPKATDENIAAMRLRYEELGREAYDRRGDFTGDLRDEHNRLNSVIREYDNARAPKEFAPPPERGRPERMTTPPEEKEARQAALRRIQHSTLGLVTESANQKGVPSGKLRVEAKGKESIIQNPRTTGNRSAAFVKAEPSIPSTALPELQDPNAPKAPNVRVKPPVKFDYTIPDTAVAELKGKAQPGIVQRMARLARTPSSPVEIPKLREQFPGMSKAEFDSEMAKLNEQGRIALHRHDHPASLSESARGSMVKIGNDYFTAATFREKPGTVMGMGLGGLQPLLTKQNLKRAGAEAADLINLPRALMASADLSAPLRQGAILTLPPSQWKRAGKATVRMFQALSSKQFEKISEQINAHPDAETGRKAKLHISTDKTEGLRKSEEDFLSRWADKIPIVKQSQQAYQTYLDSLRMDTFAKYKRVIDKNKGLSPEQRDSAYKAAAEWINIATGRGSLGKTFESAMPLLSKIAFAPRYTASRVQILNPATYAKNASTSAGRAVLKQQMTDVVQFAGVISATLAIASAAGAEVGTDPEDSDFLKIKVGNVRYDTLAGLQQVMRLFYRVGKDVGKATVGQKSGEGAVEVAGRFARSKLAPVPSFFVDALSRKDFIGRDFEVGRGVKERMLPLMWKDFYDAYQREGIGGAAKLSPGVFGLGVQDFAKRPGILTQKNEAYTGELKRLGVQPAESAQRLKDEPDDLFKGRAGKIESWRDQYGSQLIQHPMYQRLNDAQKKAAVESLHGRISEQANEKRPNLRAFNPAGIVRGVREGERSRRRTDRDKIYVAPR